MMRRGFTLVELLVVIVIIGILVTLVLPRTLKAIRQARNRECASNIRTINTALQMCFAEEEDWTKCDSSGELTAGKYLDSWPTDPYGVAYTLTGNPKDGYEVTVSTHFASWPDITTHR